MTTARRITFRLIAIVLALGSGAILIEGVSSLVLDRSFFRGRAELRRPLSLEMTLEERRKAALLTPGPFLVPVDPWLGTELKPNFRGDFLGASWSSDESGRRRPLTPRPAPAGTRRILLLGDSVAFGFGVQDHETIGACMEELLGRAGFETPSPVVDTLAVPGWNFQNVRRALLNRLDEWNPDIVVFLTVDNDLDDSYSATEAGFRNTDFDPARGGIYPHCTLQRHHEFVSGLRHLRRPAAFAGPETAAFVLSSGVSPESIRRYNSFVAGLKDMDERLRLRGAAFVPVFLSGGIHLARVSQWRRNDGEKSFVECLFGGLTPEMSLTDDPHPNAATCREAARRLISILALRGLVPNSAVVESPSETNHIPLDHLSKSASAKDEWDEKLSRQIQNRVSFEDGSGFHQVYGGFAPDGTMRNTGWFALRKRSPRHLKLRWRVPEGGNSAFPLQLDVSLNDFRLTPTTLSGSGGYTLQETILPIPSGEKITGEIHDILLSTSNWRWVAREHVPRLESIQVASIEVE